MEGWRRMHMQGGRYLGNTGRVPYRGRSQYALITMKVRTIAVITASTAQARFRQRWFLRSQAANIDTIRKSTTPSHTAVKPS